MVVPGKFNIRVSDAVVDNGTTSEGPGFPAHCGRGKQRDLTHLSASIAVALFWARLPDSLRLRWPGGRLSNPLPVVCNNGRILIRPHFSDSIDSYAQVQFLWVAVDDGEGRQKVARASFEFGSVRCQVSNVNVFPKHFQATVNGKKQKEYRPLTS